MPGFEAPTSRQLQPDDRRGMHNPPPNANLTDLFDQAEEGAADEPETVYPRDYRFVRRNSVTEYGHFFASLFPGTAAPGTS